MVWDVVADLASSGFVDQTPLRVGDINALVEATYLMAPNYWEQIGDLAIGGDFGGYDNDLPTFRRFPAPTQSGLFLTHGGGTNLVWGGAADLFLVDGDEVSDSVGASFITSSILIRRPHQVLSEQYRRTGTAAWELQGSSRVTHTAPLVSINTFPDSSNTMSLRYDGIQRIVRLFCDSDISVGMMVHQSSGVHGSMPLNELFPRHIDIGLTSNVNTQYRTFDIASTGVFSATNAGFELLDLTSLYRDDFFGDYSWYLYVTLFYRY